MMSIGPLVAGGDKLSDEKRWHIDPEIGNYIELLSMS